MLKVKRLYTFIIQTFLPVFLMTFVICLFILLMQFLWKYVEDLVGKGLDNSVIAELFFYAMLNLIPLGLPLAILLASLMTFGNMGERLELLSIKAAGVSLLKAMRPLIILISCVSIGAFFFQNEAMPRINIKFRTLLSSVKHKSPELEIPEGSFYSGINNYSIYVKKKNPETKMLHNVMIYDTSNGFSNMSVFVCDSARMRISAAKDFLLLNLYDGQRFANFRDPSMTKGGSMSYTAGANKFIPYSRENFKEKAIIIPFDSNFDRMDESAMDNHQSAKNISMLAKSIDSMSLKLDSLNLIDRKIMENTYLSYRSNQTNSMGIKDSSSAYNKSSNVAEVAVNFDSLISSFDTEKQARIFERATTEAEQVSSNYMFQTMNKSDLQKAIRYHKVEWHRKFTLSFACLVFFFIGAPLGAIIRKGGLGMPVVVSVGLFIVYYIFDNIGLRMAQDGVWPIWQGMWLSSFVLFPLGVFLTYKAMNDSALFNAEAYGKYIRKILQIRPQANIKEEKDINPDDVVTLVELNADPDLVASLDEFDDAKLKDIAKNYKQYGYDDNTLQVILGILKERGDNFFGVRIKNLDYEEASLCIKEFNRSARITAILYAVGICLGLLTMILYFISGSIKGVDIVESVGYVAAIAYIIFFIRTIIYYFDFYHALDRKKKTSNAILMVLSAYSLFIILFPHLRKQMREDMDSIKW